MYERSRITSVENDKLRYNASNTLISITPFRGLAPPNMRANRLPFMAAHKYYIFETALLGAGISDILPVFHTELLLKAHPL